MCGIIGKISNANGSSISEWIKTLNHRGPDDSGYSSFIYADRRIEFGHTRLSIIDLSSSGSQPMESKDGRYIVSYNGEIYNHKEIRQKLNIPFKGHSDTETLVEAVATWGVNETLPLLNGMFGFALLDKKNGKVYLVRDPFGIKPVYYFYNQKKFAFSSEIRGLSAMNIKCTDIDSNAVQTFLTLRYIPSPDTLFKKIKRLPPGHMLCYDIEKNRVSISSYIKPVTGSFSGSIDDAVDVYTATLKNAVKSQLLSDVPVGVLLSGGIDSSLIAAMAAETGKSLPCFTVGFGSQYKDCEIEDAAQTAAILGMEHNFIEVDSNDLWSVFSDVIKAVEEPLGTTSILPMWYLVKKAKEDVTVVLAGQGNDEPWGGYRRYQAEIWRSFFPFSSVFKGLNSFSSLCNLPDFAERAFRSLSVKELPKRFEEAYALFASKERFALTGASNNGNALNDIKYWLSWIDTSKMQPVEKMMQIDTRMNLADDLLLYADKTSMAVSLETRVPMLDIDLVRLVESFPIKYKLGLQKTKIVHKIAAERYLPKEIINRSKKNFQVPFAQWARGKWRDRIESVLFYKNAPYLSILDFNGVKKIWKDHLSGKKDKTRQLFALLSFAICIENRR